MASATTAATVIANAFALRRSFRFMCSLAFLVVHLPPLPRHRRTRQLRLIGGLGVALDLLERRVAADRGDLMHRASSLGEPTAGGLPQTMEGTRARQSGLVAGFGKPRGEGVRIERLAALRHDEGQLRRRHHVDDRAQLGMDRNRQRLAGLLLRDVQQAVADVLPPHRHHIAAPLCREQAKCERQPFARADRMRGFELRDLFFGPSMEAVAGHAP
jgi:hypothetical protein